MQECQHYHWIVYCHHGRWWANKITKNNWGKVVDVESQWNVCVWCHRLALCSTPITTTRTKLREEQCNCIQDSANAEALIQNVGNLCDALFIVKQTPSNTKFEQLFWVAFVFQCHCGSILIGARVRDLSTWVLKYQGLEVWRNKKLFNSSRV